jgi:shikimate kinase
MTSLDDQPESKSPEAPEMSARPIVLVGLMGAGKTTIGRRLAARLGVPFVDSDAEIEAAAGYSVQDIFDKYGEAAFREGERKVLLRLLKGERQVIATGGGAFMDAVIRQAVADQGTSVWLRATLPVLLERVGRRNNRPLLKTGDPGKILDRLMAERYPIYAESDIVVESGAGPHHIVVDSILTALDTLGCSDSSDDADASGTSQQ